MVNINPDTMTDQELHDWESVLTMTELLRHDDWVGRTKEQIDYLAALGSQEGDFCNAVMDEIERREEVKVQATVRKWEANMDVFEDKASTEYRQHRFRGSLARLIRLVDMDAPGAIINSNVDTVIKWRPQP